MPAKVLDGAEDSPRFVRILTRPCVYSSVAYIYPLWSGLEQSVLHRTLGQWVPDSIPVQGVVFCGLEQVTFPQLSVYSGTYALKDVRC